MKTILYRLDIFVELNELKRACFFSSISLRSPQDSKQTSFLFFYGQHSSKISELVDFVG